MYLYHHSELDYDSPCNKKFWIVVSNAVFTGSEEVDFDLRCAIVIDMPLETAKAFLITDFPI
jgi:hypothetical protein